MSVSPSLFLSVSSVCLFVLPSVLQSVCPSIFVPSVCLSILLQVCPSYRLSFLLSVCCLSVLPSVCTFSRSVCHSICSFSENNVHMSVCPYLFLCLSDCLTGTFRLSDLPSLCISFLVYVCPFSVCVFFCLCPYSRPSVSAPLPSGWLSVTVTNLSL